jgi:hypothetical protein
MWLFLLLGENLPLSIISRIFNIAYRLGDASSHIRRVCGEAVLEKCNPIWGLDKEGELNGAWRDMGIKGLWYMMGMLRLCLMCGWVLMWCVGTGNLALARFHSKHVALRTWFCSHFLVFWFADWPGFCVEIKAMEEGIFGERYSAAE